MPVSKSRKRTKQATNRETIYEEVTVKVCSDEAPLTLEQAKQLLGWTEESEEEKFKEYLVKDSNGTKIKCFNNVSNRPLYLSNVDTLKQEILRRNWKFNGEPIIVGRTGLILNGQHTLIALIFAVQTWEQNPDAWPEWKEEPTIDKLLVLGVSEIDSVVNTMDTCKPRTLADVIYRSDFFTKLPARDRKGIARVCSYAVNTLWERMGAEHAFAPRQTHAEALHFLEKHPKVLKAVHHVCIENNDNSISRYLSLGYAAGLLYLMGCSTTDPEEYLKDSRESKLDWTNWEKACEFFVLLASSSKAMDPLKKAVSRLIEEGGGSRKERMALVAKAWTQWVERGKLSCLQLKYEDQDGMRVLTEEPTVGGIDLVQFE